MKKRSITASLFLSAVMAVAWAADIAAQVNPPTTRASNTSGATGSHDPSRMILCDGKYYVYSTGGGMKYSSDQVTWTAGPSPFAAVTSATAPSPTTDPTPTTAAARGRGRRGATPASVKAIIPDDRGIWAPDVIFYNNKYYLYYSVAAPHILNHCATGLLTSPTLDPSSPDYKWTDAGVVISTWNEVVKKSAIDPCPFVDANGDLWMSWGSGYANGSAGDDPTIIISKLDNATGLRSTTDTKDYAVAPGHTEGSFVYYHSGFYYAFWNDGGSGPPPNATYRIHIARSKTVTGPYLNRAGNAGVGDIFMATVKEQDLQGPGHMGIETEPGVDRFTFHYYTSAGRPVLGVRTLVWDGDGWPSVGEDLAEGTYKITADNGLAIGVRGGDVPDGAVIDLQPYTGSDFQKWSVTLSPEGYYRLTSVGSGKLFEVGEISNAVKNADGVIDQAVRAGLQQAGAKTNQQWIIELLSDGKTYCLKPRSSHAALGFSGADVVAGEKKTPAGLTISPWNNVPSQKWIFSAP